MRSVSAHANETSIIEQQEQVKMVNATGKLV